MAAEMRQCDRHIPTVVSATSTYREAMVNALFGATAVIVTFRGPASFGTNTGQCRNGGKCRVRVGWHRDKCDSIRSQTFQKATPVTRLPSVVAPLKLRWAARYWQSCATAVPLGQPIPLTMRHDSLHEPSRAGRHSHDLLLTTGQGDTNRRR